MPQDDPFEAPEVIYLQAWASEVSWCVDEIGGPCDEPDVKYIRADVIRRIIRETMNEQIEPETDQPTEAEDEDQPRDDR